MLRTDLLTFGVTGAVFKIAGEVRRLLAYFDNPDLYKSYLDTLWLFWALK